MTKALCFDVETTTHNSGSWSDSRNELVLIACTDGKKNWVFNTTKEQLEAFAKLAQQYDTLVGFNIKFDLHWVLNYGLDLTHIRVYDVQLAEYIHSRQTVKYPSLNDCSLKYLDKQKIDTIKELYWDLGIQTTDIPWDVLSEYATKDVDLTWELYQHFLTIIRPHQKMLLSVANQDLIGLLWMEHNGNKYDRTGSLLLADEQDKTIQEIQVKLNLSHSCPSFNWSSNPHLSALLYGGTITEIVYVPEGIYKSGQRKGQVKLRKQIKTHYLPRLYEPLKDTEMAKAGVWSVEEDTLLKLKGKNRALIDGVLQMKKLQKDNNTYLRGMPKRQDEGFYSKDMIYGSFIQVNTETGRLASVKPNLQNLSDTALQFFVSRYE